MSLNLLVANYREQAKICNRTNYANSKDLKAHNKAIACMHAIIDKAKQDYGYYGLEPFQEMFDDTTDNINLRAITQVLDKAELSEEMTAKGIDIIQTYISYKRHDAQLYQDWLDHWQFNHAEEEILKERTLTFNWLSVAYVFAMIFIAGIFLYTRKTPRFQTHSLFFFLFNVYVLSLFYLFVLQKKIRKTADTAFMQYGSISIFIGIAAGILLMVLLNAMARIGFNSILVIFSLVIAVCAVYTGNKFFKTSGRIAYV